MGKDANLSEREPTRVLAVVKNDSKDDGPWHKTKDQPIGVLNPSEYLVRAPANFNPQAFRYFRRLARLEEFALDSSGEPLSLQTAATIAGLEKTYFCKYFRRKTGVSFRDWLNWIRVLHAVGLLRDRNRSLTQLAYTVGFQDQRTFQRAFRKHTGLSASEIKRLVSPQGYAEHEKSLRADDHA